MRETGICLCLLDKSLPCLEVEPQSPSTAGKGFRNQRQSPFLHVLLELKMATGCCALSTSSRCKEHRESSWARPWDGSAGRMMKFWKAFQAGCLNSLKNYLFQSTYNGFQVNYSKL